MNNFEVISVLPMSDSQHPREIARKAVAGYRSTKLNGQREPPPIGSKRRVMYAASTGHKRSRIERIKSALRGIVQKAVGC